MLQNNWYLLDKAFHWDKHRIYRGNSELKPKNIDIVKSFVSMARELDLGAEDPLFILASLQDQEIKRLLAYLSELKRIIILAPTVNSLFTVLESVEVVGPHPITMLSFSSVHEELDQEELLFAQSLCFNDPQLEIRASDCLQQRLRAHLRGDYRDPQPFIFEERPGKFRIWDVEENTIKHNMKKTTHFLAASQKETVRQPFFADSGFSLCQMKIGQNIESNMKNMTHFSSIGINYKSVVDFGVFAFLSDQISKFVTSKNMRVDFIRKIYISSAWLSVAGFLSEWLKKNLCSNAEFFYLEHCFGWNPLASCLQSMKEIDQGMNLHIYFGPRKLYLSLTWN